jgi:group II intron reverse transcriptase/maturase
MSNTLRLSRIFPTLRPIAQRAIHDPDCVFTSLAHLITVPLLHEAYVRTRKDGAAGVDDVTADEYGADLFGNLTRLHERLRTQRYVAPPVRRTWLDKDDGSKRPIGIPTLEDKVVQRAVAMVMAAVYEQDFHVFSHGFRPGHSPHQALHELRTLCLARRTRWIVDADVSGFFDTLDHGVLRQFIRRRINDGGLLRLVGKWLKAGVIEDGQWMCPDTGTPQGGVISPLLGNIYLHHVLDEWYEHEVRPRMRGRTFLIRYADDFVIGCEQESDARRIMEVLPQRFARFGLTIHPDKTKLLAFSRPAPALGSASAPSARPGTFDFLGFTHYWGRTRRGGWALKRKTARQRLSRSMRRVWQWCRWNRHLPVLDQARALRRKLQGHYQYYGLRGNSRALRTYLFHVMRAWRYWLSRRSRGRRSALSFEAFERLLAVFPLPAARIVHSI